MCLVFQGRLLAHPLFNAETAASWAQVSLRDFSLKRLIGLRPLERNSRHTKATGHKQMCQQIVITHGSTDAEKTAIYSYKQNKRTEYTAKSHTTEGPWDPHHTQRTPFLSCRRHGQKTRGQRRQARPEARASAVSEKRDVGQVDQISYLPFP